MTDTATNLSVFDLYPWLREFGFSDIVEDLLVEFGDAITSSAILTEIRTGRGAARYNQIFPGNVVGSRLLFNERDYLERMDDYRDALREGGIDPEPYTNAELAQFINPDVDVDPNELRDRLTIYNDLKRSGRHVRDAFYVYAGIRMSDDDLYSYVVDPTARVEFDQRYAQQVSINPPDYATFITRATEAGLDRVAETLSDLENQGLAIRDAATRVARIDPEFARSMADLIYSNGPTLLNLDELTASMEYALIGGAASRQGLQIPTLERVAEIRQAGVDRSAALQQYGVFARQRDILAGLVDRATAGERSFTQSDFEDAVFFFDAEESDILARAQAREVSFGRAQGNVSFGTDRQGRLRQSGFRSALT